MRKHRLFGFTLAVTVVGASVLIASGNTSTVANTRHDTGHHLRSKTVALATGSRSASDGADPANTADIRLVSSKTLQPLGSSDGLSSLDWRPGTKLAVGIPVVTRAATAMVESEHVLDSTAVSQRERIHRVGQYLVAKKLEYDVTLATLYRLAVFAQAVTAHQQAEAAQAAQAAASTRSTASSPAATPAPSTTSGGAWAALRACESGGNYADNTGNGYYGAYQFSAGTWHSLGYSGLPSEAPPAEQDAAAQQLQARSGWGQWPACSAKLGLR